MRCFAKEGRKEEAMMKKENFGLRDRVALQETDASASAYGFVLFGEMIERM